jgi:hypothetical protein
LCHTLVVPVDYQLLENVFWVLVIAHINTELTDSFIRLFVGICCPLVTGISDVYVQMLFRILFVLLEESSQK